MSKIVAIDGVTVTSYRTKQWNMGFNEDTMEREETVEVVDIVSVAIDPVRHDGGLAMTKSDLKDFIRILKKELRNAHKTDITMEVTNV